MWNYGLVILTVYIMHPTLPPFAASRFCSADLAKPSAFYNSVTGERHLHASLWTAKREALKAAFAHPLQALKRAPLRASVAGQKQHRKLPRQSYEQDKTVVCITDDSSPSGQVPFYNGKQNHATGNRCWQSRINQRPALRRFGALVTLTR